LWHVYYIYNMMVRTVLKEFRTRQIFNSRLRRFVPEPEADSLAAIIHRLTVGKLPDIMARG